ncbi:MAG: efflux RND transporter permease subunit [bacterium]|nr:efflux RND transporter permease subunit [bacterium]
MKNLVRWAIGNTPAVNVLVVAVLVAGFWSFTQMRREVFPEFELEVVLVSIPYPGASPSDCEKGVCQPVEEAIRSLDGIKRLVSIAREGGGYVLVELNSNVRDVQKVVTDIRSRVDRVTNFPDLAEDPQVEQITFRESAIRVAIMGPKSDDPDSEIRLREVAESVRSELLDLATISQAEIQGAKPYQIDVEVSEDTLRKHGLTLSTVANILRRENIEMPGGQLKADGQEILLRGKNRRELGEEIAELPVITQPGGVVLSVRDIGSVQDEFDDSSNINEVNGQPALVISIDRTSDEDLLQIADEVHAYVAQAEVPPGYSLQVWGDTSIDVRDRMRMLRDNGLQGLLFVFLLLALFLEFRLAFWVSLGIPICVLGAGLILLATGQTLNMLSMFAFLMALGIVVDDAIVVGENIYAHRNMGKDFYTAAIDGTIEVLPSVTTAILTTIVAFMPFFFVEGVMGKFIAVMPVAIIAMLVISLIEASTALPCHLSHGSHASEKKPKKRLGLFSLAERTLDNGSHVCGRGMEWFGDHVYLPILRFLLHYPFLGVGVGLFLLLGTFALTKVGFVKINPFPKTDSNQILAQVAFPDGTPARVSDAATRKIETAARRVSQKIYNEENGITMTEEELQKALESRTPQGPVKLTFRQVGQLTAQGAMGSTGGGTGSSVGQVFIELQDAGERSISSGELINRWRNEAGEISGAERVVYDSAAIGPGGKPIEFKLLAAAKYQDQLEGAVEEAKSMLEQFAGVYDVRDDATPGKTEFQIRVKERAQSMGLTSADLAETIRNSYYGAEVMRLQRGRHEVKLMVRYPEDERTSLAQFNDIRVRGSDGIERPINELAEVTVTQAYAEINRLNQQRSITITADLDSSEGNQFEISQSLKSALPALFREKYPQVSVNWEGQSQQTAESLQSLLIGSAAALLVMYLLLVVEFRSYFQPFLIMCIIPFGIIGAAWGHIFMGLEITLFSFFGLVALTGIVVNDSIVLVDFINSRVRAGMEPNEALLEAGRRRLRPVFLTSLTTIGGLVPMLMETSFQAQFLVPMATSIAFGLMLSTLLVLFQVPVFFRIYLIIADLFGHDPSADDPRMEQAESGNQDKGEEASAGSSELAPA